MQPRNPFQGGPVSGLVFPTEQYLSATGAGAQQVANAAAQAAEMEANARKQMVDSLVQGALGGYSAYAKGTGAAKDFKAMKAMAESPSYQKMIGLDEKSAPSFLESLDKMQSVAGYETANRFGMNIMQDLFKYNLQSQQMANQLKLAGISSPAAMMGAKTDWERLQWQKEQKGAGPATPAFDPNIFGK